jgi:hypothetical protein
MKDVPKFTMILFTHYSSVDKGVEILMTLLKTAAVTIMFAFFLAFIGSVSAQDVSVQKLLEVEEQLRSEQKKNEETKETIVQLEKKVQCTYGMVKGYENCDASFTEKNEDYLDCMQKVRKEKEDCMLDTAAE